MRNNQKGFSVVELILVIVIVALVGFVGYYVFNQRQANNTAKETSVTTAQVTTNQSQTANDVAKAPAAINSTSDLDKAISTVDNTDVSNGNDVNSLDSQLAGF